MISLPILQMTIIRNHDNSFGLVFPSEVNNFDQSQSISFCIAIPNRIRTQSELEGYLKRVDIIMPFYWDGKTVTVKGKIKFPTIELNVSKYAKVKPLLFNIEMLNEFSFNTKRPPVLKRISKISLSATRFYNRNFRSNFVRLKYQGDSSIIKSNLYFILISPLDIKRYSELFLENKLLPIGATLKFGVENLEYMHVIDGSDDLH